MSSEHEPNGSTNYSGPIAFMAQSSIAANLLMVFLLGGGVWAIMNVQKEVIPEFALDTVLITVPYPGAAPTEVEQGILRPIEQAVRGIDGIEEMVSTAEQGNAEVSIELVAGTDRMKAFQDIDQAISRIRTFPEEIERPEVALESNQREVMSVGLYGDVDLWELRNLAENVRDQLLSTPGLTQVQLDDPPDYVTHVEIDRETLRTYGLTLEEVGDIIAASSLDVPAGSIETSSGEILLRMQERKQLADQFAEIEVISVPSGGSLTLADIATIRDGFEEDSYFGRFNGTPSIDVQVFRIGDQSPLDVAEAVQRVMETLAAEFPDGVEYRIDRNAASDYRDRLNLLTENGMMTVFIVLLVLALFLEYRLAFWVMVGMTIAFVGAVLFLPVLDLSLNMISMFGFLMALGIVVDDAIVVGENVYEYREQGMSPLDAALKGAREMAQPVTFAILTNIIAFVPLLFIPGTTGKYWFPLPAVVILVLAVSLLEALFILPAHLAHTSPEPGSRLGRTLVRYQQRFGRLFQRFIDTVYRWFLDLCLTHRYVTTTISSVALALFLTYGFSDHMGFVLMPESAADEIEAGVSLPAGSTIQQAGAVAEEITRQTYEMFDEHNLFEQASGVKTNVRRRTFVDVELVLLPPDERTMTAREIIELWRGEIGDVPGVDQIIYEAERGPGGYRQDIEVDLSHTDLEVLDTVTREFVSRVESFEASRDVTDNADDGLSRFDFQLRPEARRLGLTAEEVGTQLRAAFYGDLAMRDLRGTNEFEVRVKLPREQRQELWDLEDMVIRTDDGVEVPLLDVAEVYPTEAAKTINRRDGRRVITVGLDAEPPSAVSQVLRSIQTEVLPELRSEYPGLTWTFVGSQAEVRESTNALYGGFFLALLAIYALLAVALSSYVQPIIIIAAIPFGFVGAIIGHLLLGYDLSLVSMMGVIALSGVVLNDSLIMIDHANANRGDQPAYDAILQAGIRRFRPIALTTLTTFAGLTPIILETSAQARQLIPVAISLGFGIVFATGIILVLVPCLYLIVEDVAQLWSGSGKDSGQQ